jgi:hypothetical protein
VVDGRSLEPLCCIFSSAEEDAVDLEAGAEGAELVFLQFPSKTAGLLA